MKTAFLPVAMLDAERAAGPGIEDTSGNEQQPAAGAFDAVLAMVAAQVATLGAANKPAAPSVALPQAPQVAGEPAKDLTRATANTTGDSALWLDGARAMQLAGLAHGPTDVLPGVPFHQLVATQVGQPPVSAAPTVEALPTDVQTSALVVGPAAPPTGQPRQDGGTKIVQADSPHTAPIDAEKSVVSAPTSGPAAVGPAALAPAPQTPIEPPIQELAAPVTKRAVVESRAVRADEAGAPQVNVPEPSAQTDARLLVQSGSGLASPVQVATPAGAASNNVTNAETMTSSTQKGTAPVRSRGVSRVEQPLEAPSEADLRSPAFSLSLAQPSALSLAQPSVLSLAQPSALRVANEQSPAATTSELAAAQAPSPSTPVQSQPAVGPQLAAAVPAPIVVGPNLASQPRAVVAPTELAGEPVRTEAPLPVAANVQVELVELASEQASGNEGAPGELSPRGQAGLDAKGEQREPSSDAERQGEAQQGEAQQGEARQGASEQRNPQPQSPSFQGSEVQGARGLEQVVASLLRASTNGDVASPRAAGSPTRGPAVRNTAQQVLTQKSGGEKSAQLSGDASQALLQAAQRREQELAERELSVAEPAQLPVHLDAKVATEPSVAEPAPAALPLPTPSTIADPDAALMGKLARGEGVNAANISIDHPELGAMDLLVRSENGRVDVRATAETPKAAAVLRAHESALRYGIQQAGMTFGALKVRSRGGEAPVASKRVARASDDGPRDAVEQRRRNHEWEA